VVPFGHLDKQAARLVDEEWEKVMGGDEVSVDGEPEYAETLAEVVLPDGSVPLTRAAFEELAAPDVVDENVDAAVVFLDLLGQAFHLVGFEMVDRDCNAGAAEVRDEFRGLFDCLGTVVVGLKSSCAATATGADDGRARFAQGQSNAAPGSSGRPRNDGDATTKCVVIR